MNSVSAMRWALMLDSVSLQKVEHTASELRFAVRIVSAPPDQNRIQNRPFSWPRLPRRVTRRSQIFHQLPRRKLEDRAIGAHGQWTRRQGTQCLVRSATERSGALNLVLAIVVQHGGHSCVTHSRNQEDTEGHERARRRVRLSTGGQERKRRDTRGHDIRPVRDREAPGSNPGPPTRF